MADELHDAYFDASEILMQQFFQLVCYYSILSFCTLCEAVLTVVFYFELFCADSASN
jgi:hypothetical protein